MTRSSFHKKELVLAYGCRGTRARHGRIGRAASGRHGGRSRKQGHLQPHPWGRGRKVDMEWDYRLSRKLPVAKHSSCNTAALPRQLPNSTMSWKPGIKIPKLLRTFFFNQTTKSTHPKSMKFSNKNFRLNKQKKKTDPINFQAKLWPK